MSDTSIWSWEPTVPETVISYTDPNVIESRFVVTIRFRIIALSIHMSAECYLELPAGSSIIGIYSHRVSY
jgi:hypothetical protein